MPDSTDVGPDTGVPQVKRPQRDQIEYRACCWNDLLPDSHQARIVWDYVESLDCINLKLNQICEYGSTSMPSLCRIKSPLSIPYCMGIWRMCLPKNYDNLGHQIGEIGVVVEFQKSSNSLVEQAVFEILKEDSLPRMERDSDVLTKRERQVLRLIAEGRSNLQTASELAISVKTVNAHRYNLMKKLNVHNVQELVRYAIRQGIVTP